MNIFTFNLGHSIELNFFNYLVESFDYKILYEDFYEYKNNYWQKIRKTTLDKLATDFLIMYFPSKADANKATASVKFAIMQLKHLEKHKENTIIACKNKYLQYKENALFVIAPDKKYDLTHQVEVDINDDVDTVYMPKPAPKDSKFAKFITSSLPDEKVRAYVQEFLGYTLFPNNSINLQACQMWIGDGQNGKGALLKLIKSFHQNPAALNLAQLNSTFAFEHILDASILIADEAPKSGIDEDAFKRLISGDPFSVSMKYKATIPSYQNDKALIVTGNNVPRFRDNSNGIGRRIQFIPFITDITDSEKIDGLDEILLNEERMIVFDWLLEGALRLLKRGKFAPTPRACEIVKEDFKNASNNVLFWVTGKNVDLIETNSTDKEMLYDHYREFITRNGKKPLDSSHFWIEINRIFKGKLDDSQKNVTEEGIKTRKRFVNIGIGVFKDLNKEQAPESNIQKNKEMQALQKMINEARSNKDLMGLVNQLEAAKTVLAMSMT